MTIKERKKNFRSQIEEYATALKMTAISSNYLEIVKEAELKDISYDEFLADILRKEYEKHQENSRNNRIRMAQFPYKKYLEDLIVEDLPEDARKKYKLLTSLNFIEEGQSVILAGNPGTGNYRKYLVMERFSVAP